MGKKRPSDETPEPNAAAKKEKMTEFNGTLFKSMLKDPTKAMKGLEMFIATAKKLPSSELYDVVEGYIKISMECAEMFKLLEGGKQTEREMVLIFESLEMILLRTASDLTHFSMVGNAIVKKVVASHMKLIQGSFQSENHRLVRQCLSLLSASISQGPEAAREILNHIYINKSLSALARRKDKRGKPDIRMAFIQFALSFLVSGDNATIGQILEVKELLPEILSTGLKEDRMSIVNLILSTLKSRVVLNKAITKTQKVRFFTAPQLANIASLYKWNGIVDAIVDDNEMEDGSEVAAIAVVREMAHSFLLDLCCSRRHGISFHDPSFGTAGRAGNIVLLQFLVGLKQATEDELVAELVVRTLKASPDVLTRYFKEMQYSYLPRLKSAWQDNVRLLKKIYEAQPELSVVFQPSELVALPRLLSMITVVSLPPVCNKAFFTQGLNFANTAVQLTTFTMMSFILKKAAKNVAFLKGYHSDVYTPDMMADLVQQYTEMLTKILPDMTSVVSQWQSLSKKDKTEGEGSKTDKDASEEQTASVAAPDTPEVVLLKALILQVICLYQKVVPHLVTQCKFDFSKLLKGVVSEGGVNEEVAPVLQHQILQLALDLPASKFSWFRLQEAADNDEKSVLYLLLKMFVSSRCGHLKNSTRMLVLKVLKDSGVFEYTWAELELWLDQLDLVEPSQQEMVIQFLERVFVKLVSHSHMYTDTVASLVQEAAYQQSNLSSQEGDAASVCVSHIDDVLDMLDVIMDGSEGDAEELDTPLSEDIVVQTFPFSVAVPAALEARNKLNQDKGVVFEYLSTVLCHILHGQRDPLPLCLGLLQYDKKLASSCSSEPPVSPHVSVLHLHRYYSEWLPQQCREELFKCSQCLPDKTSTLSFTSLMKAAYLDGLCVVLEDKFRTKVEVAIDSMTVAEHLVSIKQILLYVKSAVDNFISFSKNTGSAVLKTLMGILQDLVSKLQRRQVPSDPEPAEQNNLDGSDLFLDMNQSSNVEANKEQILLSALKCIFQHPCFLQWYLSLELGALPPHPLNPVRLKHMCAQLSNDITTLLMISAPTLCELGHTEILAPYVGAVEKAVLKELLERPSQTPKRQSKPFQAFLSLHSYMDPSKVRDLLSALLLLQQERLVTAQGELSVYGQATLQILTETDQYRDDGIFLSQARLGGLATLLLSCASPALEAFLLQTLSREPGSARLVHTDVLHHCLRRPLRDPLAIADLLLSNCSTQRLCFEMWCLQAENLEKMTNMTEEFLPLIRAYLLVVGREDPAVPKEVQQEVLKSLKENLLAKLIQSALRESIEDATLVEALAALIKLTADIGDIWDLVHNLPDALQKADSFERWQLVDVITEKLCNCPEEEVTWRKLVTAAALKCLVASYGQAKDQAKSTSKQEQSVLERLQSLITSADDVAAADWNAFVKNGLKYRYRDEHFLTTLRSLLEIVYRPTDITDDLVPLATLHMMTSSHSLFLPTMLDSEDGDLSTCHAKEALVSLLLCLVKKCPAACNMNHFLVLLGAYGATLNNTDQTILLLLQEYEKNNVSLLKFQSIMWGPAALEHHKTRKSLASSLWKQTHADDLLALLNADKMLRTIAHFPQHRKIIPQADKAQLFHDKAVNNLEELYDPCFLLPLFSAILRPESVVDCQKFVSAHALGLTVVALSSYDGKVRAGAYHVLSCFYQHLEGARFREKKQLLYLLDTVKNGVRQENQRIPFVLTTYISKVAQQMLKPEDYMYVVLNRFLLSHQSLDLHRVPEFFKLFYSFDLEHKTEREWILSVLEGGISDGYCYEVCNQQGIFHSLLGFGSSPLCDDRTQAQIIRVLSQAARVTKAAYDLSKSCGLLTWIIHMVEKRQLGQHLLGSIIDLLHVLWLTNLGKKENPIAKGETSTLEQETVKCLPLTLINEFLCAALTIIPRLRLGVKAAQLSTFLQTLSSILKHRTSALHVSDQAGRVTLQAQPLSSAEAVALLMCWSTLSGHTTLLGQKQTLFEKHQVKELLGRATRGKIRCKGSQARTHKENLSEDTETEERQQSLLTECRLTLGSIFVHWRPVFAPSEPDCTEGPNLLAVETGVLLTKWSLGCLVEGSYDEERSKGFLHWIEESVMEYGEIVDALLRDAEFNADLLRLYHHTCQTSTGETFRSFTDLMRRLLERRGQLSAMHRAVVSACQPEDEAKCEAGLSLLSLYIHEMWSGADSPQLFLSHVAMVTRSGRKQRKALPSAVRAVCQDFLAART